MLTKGIKLKTSSEIEVITNLYGIYKENLLIILRECLLSQYMSIKNLALNYLEILMELNPLLDFSEWIICIFIKLNFLINCFGNSDLDINAIQEYLFHGYCSSNSCIT